MQFGDCQLRLDVNLVIESGRKAIFGSLAVQLIMMTGACNAASTKGLKRGLDPLIEGRDRPLQLPNGLQLLADAELMMRAHATVQ